MSVNTHIQMVHLKVDDLSESEAFYDLVFDFIGLNKKEKKEESIEFWGPFGLMLHQQNEVLSYIEHPYRIGIVQLSVRLGKKEQVDQLYEKLKNAKFNFAWKPTDFDYTENYYSFVAFDPDENKLEFIFDG